MRSLMLLLSIVLASAPALAAEPSASDAQFFETKVRPVLADRCFKCHSSQAKSLKGTLYADTLDGLLKGGDNGPAIVPSHPEQSRLVEAIGYGNVDLQMPPKGKLSDEQIANLTEWVKRGAPWPKSAGGSTASAGGASPPAFDLNDRKAKHWAWQPIQAQTPPDVKDGAWPATSIDRFVLARLEAKGLRPAVPADKRSLIRRAYFDLIGLPPKPADVEAFVADASPDAFAKVVDRLLADAHFGERWARHWMDLVRYAETYGHEFDYPIHNAWPYRDYLIRAYNADVPYDQFVREHIAGDLLKNPRRDPTTGINESVLATGWWFFGEQVQAPVDVRQYQADRVDNQIDVYGKTFLGLTLACARCHDHKFDAISAKDYYSLFAVCESTRRCDAQLDPKGAIERGARDLSRLRDEGGTALMAALASSQAPRDEFVRNISTASDGLRERSGKAAIAADISPAADPARVEGWLKAIGDAKLKQPTHPLFALASLAGASPEAFAATKEKAKQQWDAQLKKAEETAARSIAFKDFRTGAAFENWSSTGWAFGNAPSPAWSWDLTSREPRLAGFGAADSGALAGKLAGVLRSPTFTLTKPQILYHLRGTNAKVHLIIDGYMIDSYNPLLFGGAEFKVNTGGKWVWHRQAQDVSRYVGHSAYIEIIDDGAGSIAIDQVRFADGDAPEPVEDASGIAGRVLNDPAVASPESLLAAYGTAWGEAAGRLREGNATADDCTLFNAALDAGLVTLGPNITAAMTGRSRAIDSIIEAVPAPSAAQAVADGSPIDERIFIRGSPKTLGKPAPRAFLDALAGDHQPPIPAGSGRLELADRMLDASDPFVPRVMVNRIWHHLLGRGTVASTDNFGALGSTPTHPELLDYLADRFTHADGWSVKKTIREIMLSRTYQMSASAGDATAEQADPDNALLHRANLRRLDAECIRDEILSVSGRLDDHMFGPSVDVFITPFMEGRGKPASGPLDGAGRRSLYLAERRNFLSPMMLAFDQPIPFSTMGRRSLSNVPAQALILMNDPFVVGQAKLWAERVLAEKDVSVRDRIARMYEAAFSRPPTDQEIGAATAFIGTQGGDLGIAPEQRASDVRVWADLAHTLMNVKEFVFLN